MMVFMLDPNRARMRKARRLNPTLAVPNVQPPAPYAPDAMPLEAREPYVDPAQFGRPPQGQNPDYYGQGTPSPEGEAITRPKVANPEQFTEDRLATLNSMPLDPVTGKQKLGRVLQEIGATMLESPARGGADVATNAIRGFGRGAQYVYGDTLAKEQRQEEMGRNQQTLMSFEQARQRRAQREQEALKQAQGLATYNKTLAETDKLRHPEIAPHYETRADGTYVIDAKSPDGRKVGGVPGKASDARPVFRDRRNPDGSTTTMRLNPETNKWEETDLKSAGEEKVAMQLPNGQVVQVSPGAAVTAAAQGGRVVADANNQTAWRQFEVAKSQTDKENAAALRAWEDAGQAAKQFNDLHDYVDDLAAQISGIQAMSPDDQKKNQAKFAELRVKKDKALAQLNEMLPRLQKQYGPHLSFNQRERFDVTSRPEPKPYPTPPAVSLPQGPEVVGQSKQLVDAQRFAKDHKMSVEQARELIRSNGYEPAN